jgi:HK97 family phage portal protein
VNIFGYELTFRKSLEPAPSSGGWFPLVRESSPGAWQRGETIEVDTALSHSAVFTCTALISADLAKLPISIASYQSGYWAPTPHLYDALLRKPNSYQNRQQFVRSWVSSKLLRGNTYALKQRDARGRITALHILTPDNVTPLVSSDDGSVFYRLKRENLPGIKEEVVVPAREIIHDRGITPFHPLIGVSPLTAASLAAQQGLNALENSASFFKNGSKASGIISAPDGLPEGEAAKLKTAFEAGYTGQNAGKVGVLAGSLKFQQLTMSAVDAQLLELLNWSVQDVCRCFHVPQWKIGAGNAAPYTSSESTNLGYYADCLQSLIESFELCLDEGLNLPPTERTELDVDALLRMDTISRFDSYGKAIGAGWMTPNEARRRESMPPIDGGDQCYLQQQNYALSALAKRDREEVPQ